VCAQSVNKNNNAENKNQDKKWKLKIRKTTLGQPNPGYPLFRRQS